MAKDGAHLTTWVTLETKQRFTALAHDLGVSESALLKRSVVLLLQSADAPRDSFLAAPAKVPRDLRVYVRLRADDRQLLAERAAARGIPAATYASMVMRSHLRAVAPLPDRELAELKRSVSALGLIGSNLNQIARVANQHGIIDTTLRENLYALIRALSALRDHFKGLLTANAKSWEDGSNEAR